MTNVVFLVMDVLNVLVSLILLAAAVVTAVRCGQKKLAPVAAWIMTAGFAVALFCDFSFAVSNQFLSKAIGLDAYRVVMLLLSLSNLVGFIAIAAGIGMFIVKPAPAAQEARNG
jgi:hypothetical protein